MSSSVKWACPFTVYGTGVAWCSAPLLLPPLLLLLSGRLLRAAAADCGLIAAWGWLLLASRLHARRH
eukprot:4451777-Alexandrium_andersonii.AAC.1